MSSLMSSLGLERLSTAERVQLVSEILDSLPDQPPDPLTDDEDREITRRLASMDANPSEMRPWSEVEARVLRSLEQ